MKILFISTEVWSEYNPEGIVAKKILDGFVKAGNDVDVITTRSLVADDCTVTVINSSIPEIIEKALKKIVGIEKPLFILRAIKLLHKIDINQYDLIITRSEPISIHIIGLSIRGFKGSLVSMYSDVGFLNPYYGQKSYLRKSISRLIEKKVSKKYNCITHTNSRVIDLYSKHGFETHKFTVFPNPLGKLPDMNSSLTNTNDRKTINLAYTGSLYGQRNPSFLFEYLAAQNINFKLYLIGAVRNMYYEENRLGKVGKTLKHKELKELELLIKKHGLSDRVEIMPFMKKEDLNSFIKRDIDILVNIDAQSEMNLFLSSKIVDYLQYNLPILNVSSQGATVDFLESVGVTRYLDYKDKTPFDLSEVVTDTAFTPSLSLIKQYESTELCKKLINELK